jgi:transposase InsO family protein
MAEEAGHWGRALWSSQRPTNALSLGEEEQVVSVLTSERFGALSPKQVVPQLADEGLYLASESTMYRLQRRLGLRATRQPVSRTHVARSSTVHRASGPNQVWSWYITWLPTTTRGRYLYLYLALDVWSRRIVGWSIEERESAEAGAALIRGICNEAAIDPRGLVLHSDNGKPMRGSTMVATLQWLGIVPSFSRPHVSDDNPYSEALFRTLKYTPAYPRPPFPAAKPPAAGWPASSPGTTASIATALFATSRPTSATLGSTSTSSHAAASSTSVPAAPIPNAGRVASATGHRSARSCSTQSPPIAGPPHETGRHLP